MMKHEFEQIIGSEVSTNDYEIIEKVYTWHPTISNTTGKQQIADLYKIGGMPLIKNMVETAEIMQSLDDEERKIKDILHRILVRKEVVASGDVQYERCRKELEILFDKADEYESWEKQVATLAGRYEESLIAEVRKDLKI